jgi:hypothetical protein
MISMSLSKVAEIDFCAATYFVEAWRIFAASSSARATPATENATTIAEAAIAGARASVRERTPACMTILLCPAHIRTATRGLPDLDQGQWEIGSQGLLRVHKTFEMSPDTRGVAGPVQSSTLDLNQMSDLQPRFARG